ncbi:MAG: aldehyde dehydrogenase family protein, partial [Gemmobacter sp.]
MTLTLRPAEPATEAARAFLSGPPKRLWIGGAWVPAAGGATFPTHDPATGAALAEVARAGAADADAAVAAAAAAAPAWAAMLPA